MHNYVFLIGRLTRDVEVNKYGDDKGISTITLAVNRPFRNSETNELETDFINITIWDPLCDPVKEYAKKGDLLGVKGRVSTRKYQDNGINKTQIEIIGEKITFLSSNKTTVD